MGVSIPQGTIKWEIIEEVTKDEKKVSIPQGTIKRGPMQ